MLQPPLLEGLRAEVIATPRLRTHVILGGQEDGTPVLFVHGNVSAARYWEETLAALPVGIRGIAPDLRGYGRSETAPVDATRGVRDWSDDLHALAQTMELGKVHLVGWSLGGNIVMQYAIDYPADVASITLVAGGSPFGFGGTGTLTGAPNSHDHAGSGGGTANPEFVRLLAAGDRGVDSPTSPRNVMSAFYFKPPFTSPRDDIFVDEMLTTAVGDDNYPGDMVAVETWPGVGPGLRGVNNTLSPKYLDQSAFATIDPQPPVLWVRGDADQIVSDTSFFDFGFLGQLGAVPGWPGAETYPVQPMVSQLRSVLDVYTGNGGHYREIVLLNCGHSPHVELPDAFQRALFGFLAQ